jgi:hypothetical protein
MLNKPVRWVLVALALFAALAAPFATPAVHADCSGAGSGTICTG